MQVNPALKQAIIKVLEDYGGKIEDPKGGCVKVIYDALPNASHKPAPGNMNVVTKALEYLADSGRVTLDRRGRKLWAVSHQQRHDGPGNVIATPSELDPDVAFAVELATEVDVTDDVVERIKAAGPLDVARELLGLVVQVARTPQANPSEVEGLQKKCQQLGVEVTRLQAKLKEVSAQAAKDSSAAKTAVQDRRNADADALAARKERDHLLDDKKELTQLLETAETESAEWKRLYGIAARAAAQYQDSWVDNLLTTAEGMPALTLTDILEQRDGKRRED